MKVFLSYPSSQRELALRLKLALEAEGHDLFFDRDDLPPGEAFHQRIREQLQAADVFVFLIAPASVASGSYARAELSLAEARWPRPHKHVLPVVVAPTPKADIPPYLLAVTLLEPQGDVVAETVARVATMARAWWKRPAVLAGVVLGGATLLALGGWQVKHQRDRATQLAAQMQMAEEARSALQRCLAGAANDGLRQLGTIAARPGAPPAAAVAQQDCAMATLRGFIHNQPAGLAAALPAFKEPLVQALQAPPAGALDPQRTADLRAHLGWADAMAWRDGRSPTLDPEPLWRDALVADAGNPFAHAMRGWWLLTRPPYTDEAVQQALAAFQAAEASPRLAAEADTARAFLRSVQLQGLLQRIERTGPLLQVLDRMRRGGEQLQPEQRDRVWIYVYAPAPQAEHAQRVLGALAPEDNLATFLWATPRPEPQNLSLRTWRYVHALLLRAAGRQAEAQAELVALRDAFLAERSTGSLPDAVDRLLAAR